MKTVSIFLLLCNFAVCQEQGQFTDDAKALLGSLKQLGTGQLPPGIVEAKDLASIKALRVEAAEEQVEGLRARYEGGLDNINFLLRAQIELTLARMDTTDDRAKQLEHIQDGLNSAVLVWQRVTELQKAGASGGDFASSAEAKQHVFKFYVLWHKWKAGQGIGHTMTDPGLIPR